MALLNMQDSQPTRKSGNYQGTWKLTLFTEKSENYQRSLIEYHGNQEKLTLFLEEYFLVINFLLALFSVMRIFMFWNIFLLFLAVSIILQPRFLCSKIWVFKCNTLDCCMMHHNCMNFYLCEVTKMILKSLGSFW